MTHDAWFCLDCSSVRELDIHARCSCCGSDSVTPAAWKARFSADRTLGSKVTVLRPRRAWTIASHFQIPIELTTVHAR